MRYPNRNKLERQRRQEEAKVRQENYNKLTPLQKIEKLNKLFGEGKGAQKERNKLAKKLTT